MKKIIGVSVRNLCERKTARRSARASSFNSWSISTSCCDRRGSLFPQTPVLLSKFFVSHFCLAGSSLWSRSLSVTDLAFLSVTDLAPFISVAARILLGHYMGFLTVTHGWLPFCNQYSGAIFLSARNWARGIDSFLWGIPASPQPVECSVTSMQHCLVLNHFFHLSKLGT